MDGVEVGFLLREHVLVGLAVVIECRPFLPAMTHILTLIETDRAPLRRFLGSSKPDSAGHTDEMLHGGISCGGRTTQPESKAGGGVFEESPARLAVWHGGCSGEIR